ncbi:MAG: S-layer homology domain-containing protein [Solibacillus sp.]
MANQPTKYKKFVATAATATLVASAIVPVASAASFSDVSETNSHAEAINALVAEGIIKGYADGTFKPTATLTRGHVVKMLGKWVEAQGFAVPADWNTTARFTDLAVTANDQELVKYAAVVADAGVFNGSNGTLNAAGSITRENMALTLDRAYKAVFGTSLVEEAAGLPKLTVSDLATAKTEAHEAIQALRNLEVSNVDTFNPKAAVTRAQFASFLYRTINVEGSASTPATGEVKIASVKASAVNQLTVEFNQAVDTAAAAFAVKQGTTTNIKVSDVDWNEAKTVATLTVDHKFVAATYNLTVTGVAEEALTAAVTTTREVATEIKFNSDKLVLTGAKKGDYNEARITFDVYNQYGEIITDSVPTSYYNDLKLRGLKNDSIDFSADTKGLVIAWVDKDEDEGEEGTISFTYENGDLEIDVDQDVVLSEEIEPGSVSIKGVYNVNDREFTAANVEKYAKDGDEDFFLLLEVKDQFGNAIDAKTARGAKNGKDATSADTAQYIFNSVQSGIRASVSNKNIFEVDEDDLSVENVDGKYYFAIKASFEFDNGYIEESGENTVTIRSKATGDVSESKITLADSSKVYSIGLSGSEEVVASEETVKLPVTVVDQNGNAITDAAKLNKDKNDKDSKITFSGDVKNSDVTFIEEDGKLYVEFESIKNTDADEAEDMDIEVEVEDTKQESELTIQVQPAAYPATLVKVGGGTTVEVFKNLTKKVKLSSFVIEDQYGRVYEDNFANGVTLTGEAISGALDGKKLTLNAKNEFVIDAPNAKDSSVIEFTLNSKDNEGKALTSKLSVTVRTLEEKDFDSYKVVADKAAYVDFVTSGDSAEVEVYGITTGGKEVLLSAEAYSLKAEKYLTSNYTDALIAKDDVVEIFVDTDSDIFNKMENDNTDNVKSSVTVVINRTGQVISQEITASREDREIASLTLEDEDSITKATLTKVNVTANAGVVSLAGDFLVGLKAEAAIELKDQYGKKYVESDINAKGEIAGIDSEFKYVISNVNAGNDNFSISGNGSKNASISGLAAGDSFDVTVKVDDAVKVVKVRVK